VLSQLIYFKLPLPTNSQYVVGFVDWPVCVMLIVTYLLLYHWPVDFSYWLCFNCCQRLFC